MKKILFLMLILVSFSAYSQFEGSKQIYESKDLKEKIANQKVVAILPLKPKLHIRNSLKTIVQKLITNKSWLWRKTSNRVCTLFY
ncbi:MAG: hypothetical protein QM564_04830 [Bergeyella sp.]